MNDAVTGDEPSFDAIFGAPLFEYLTAHPKQQAIFASAMAGASALRRSLVGAYRWPETGTIIDVGGSDGTILAEILHTRPGLRGIVFDLPTLGPLASQAISDAGLAGRCEFEGGSFFERVPEGGDFYILSAILHDWNDESALCILRTMRDAMKPSTRLLILGFVLPSGNDPRPGKIVDVIMLALNTGLERSEKQWRTLLANAGLSITSITPSHRVSLIEAVTQGA